MNARIKRFLWVLFSLYVTLSPTLLQAAQYSIPGLYGNSRVVPPAASALPVLRNTVQGISSVEQGESNTMVVHQEQDLAIAEWDSFNIGAEAYAHFDQKGNTDWAVLNRIYDANPSLIYGRLTSDGKVYLINQNGILFGPGSNVDVNAIAAVSLNMTNQDFLDRIQNFRVDNYIEPGVPVFPGPVSNHGNIATGSSGGVFLLAPDVENSGTIEAPLGDINIGAGETVTYQESINDDGTVSKVFDVSGAGNIVNFEDGRIISEGGTIRMRGGTIRNDGLIRSVSAVRHSGKIELLASDRVVTGSNSSIEIPITESEEKVHQSFAMTPGEVSIESGRRIELGGDIYAPSGNVSLTVGGDGNGETQARIYMDESSKIDVGGVWADKNVADLIVDVQLNSVELRDDYGQKNGGLKGETISFNKTFGSAIGNVSAYLAGEEFTAAERSTRGGNIVMTALEGDIVIRDGALLDFSGGGFRYNTGDIETSKLTSGSQTYDISDAPQYLDYELMEEYESMVREISAGYSEGSSAGGLAMLSPTVVLNGSIDGSVSIGPYQTETEELTNSLGFQITQGRVIPTAGSLTIGQMQDVTFEHYKVSDQITSEIVIQSDTASLIGFTPDTPLSEAVDENGENRLLTGYSNDSGSLYSTVLSAKTLNEAGLQSIQLYSNTQLLIEKDARLAFAAGGQFTGQARRIVDKGVLESRGGNIALQIGGNVTTDQYLPDGQLNGNYIPLEALGLELIHLAGGSRIDMSGDRIDNSAAFLREEPLLSGIIDGGSISLVDYANFGQGILLEKEAFLNVNGGYQIDAAGKVDGGGGGTVSMTATTIILDGTMTGLSIEGWAGGSLNLSADEISVSPTNPSILLPSGLTKADEFPDALSGKLILNDSFLEDSGFTRISLVSLGEITIAPYTVLAPSNAKLALPFGIDSESGLATSGFSTAYSAAGELSGIGVLKVTDEYVGDSLISLTAGKFFYDIFYGKSHTKDVQTSQDSAGISVGERALIAAALEGSVTLEAPGIDIAGTIRADAGEIKLKKSRSLVNALHIRENARLLARGYNRLDETGSYEAWDADYTPLGGGNVSVESDDLILFDNGAVIDVSAAGEIQRTLTGADAVINRITLAGNAGEVAFTFGAAEDASGLTLKGDIFAEHSSMAGVGGGALFLSRSETGGLILSPGELDSLLANGFDSLALTSPDYIGFHEADYQLDFVGELLLDAPQIKTVSGNPRDSKIILNAQYVTLQNSSNPFIGKPATGDDELIIRGAQGMKLSGLFALGGFDQVELLTGGDMVVSDRVYIVGTGPIREGGLATLGDLNLRAGRIYPVTQASFGFHAYSLDSAHSARITIEGFGDLQEDGAVYSAGGRLIFSAPNIEQSGVVKAPMGEIIFCGDYTESWGNEDKREYEFIPAARVLFSSDSITSVAGDTQVYYPGALAEDTLAWESMGLDSTLYEDVLRAPEKTITVIADEIIALDSSQLDAGGGGGIFSYRFEPGIEGSYNPLTLNERMVILNDLSLQNEGEGIILTGGGLLADGEYAILPAEYAFTVGAWILEDLGPASSLYGTPAVSEEGYTLVAGHFSKSGTNQADSTPHLFSVRKAEDVLSEGYFQRREYDAGAGGTITLTGNSVLLGGSLDISPTSGSMAGILNMSGGIVEIVAELSTAIQDIGFDDLLTPDLAGILKIGAEGLLENDAGSLVIGSGEATNSITVATGTDLRASSLTLEAKEAIRILEGATLTAVASDGAVSLLTPRGNLVIEEETTIHGVERISLDARHLDMAGELIIDHENLSIAGDEIWLVPDNFGTIPDTVLALSQSQLNTLSVNDDIELTGRSGLILYDTVAFAASGRLSIDSPRIASGPTLQAANSRIQAELITLANTSVETDAVDLNGAGRMELEADEMIVGPGRICWDGIETLHMNIAGDLVFSGEGAMTTEGDIDLTSARVTTAHVVTDDAVGDPSFQAADFLIAATGKIELNDSGGVKGDNASTGGALKFVGGSLVLDGGVIDAPSADILLSASGAEGITLKNSAIVSADGNEWGHGGRVRLIAGIGGIILDEGTMISVNSGVRGNAGTVSFSAAKGTVSLKGSLSGSGTDRGGAFSLDSANFEDISYLAGVLGQNGFKHEILLRNRGASELSLEKGSTLNAEHIKLVTDAGDMTISGTLSNSDAEDGGLIELFAGGDLTLTGNILATAGLAGAKGAEVYLKTNTGKITLDDAHIDVSGVGTDEGGIVYFRARQIPARQQEKNKPNMNLSGSIKGASQVIAEAYQVYDNDGNGNTISSVQKLNGGSRAAGVLYYEDIIDSAEDFMDTLEWDAGLKDGNGAPMAVTITPGTEIRSEGDLTVGDDWVLTDTRFGMNDWPGALTLRAAGDLVLEKSIIDRPIEMIGQKATWSHDITTWGISLVAGADLDSADATAIFSGTNDPGSLQIDDEALVYSQGAPIWFASAGNTRIGSGNEVKVASGAVLPANLMTGDKAIRGTVGGTLEIVGGAIQSATGDIELAVGKDIELKTASNALGSIRTFGRPPTTTITGSKEYWLYYGGGNLRLDVGGNITGKPKIDGWEEIYNQTTTKNFGALFNDGGTQGIIAMAGGDVTASAYGDVYASIGNFGVGNLDIVSRGDLDGRFLVTQGEADLLTYQDFGARTEVFDTSGGRIVTEIATQIEMADAQVNLTALGFVKIGTVLNPGIASENFKGYWNLGYSQESSVAINSVKSDIVYTGNSQLFNGESRFVMPGAVEMTAKRDILIQSSIYLPPSSEGQLTLAAGRDIHGGLETSETLTINGIYMSDSRPTAIYGNQSAEAAYYLLSNSTNHAVIPVHTNDLVGSYVSAGRNIQDIKLNLAEQASVSAGNDITNFQFFAQTLTADQVNSIYSGHDIILETALSEAGGTGLESTGPGAFIVQAGNNIDLGATEGIRATGGLWNPYLGEGESSLLVVAGVEDRLVMSDVVSAFAEITTAGTEYLKALSERDKEEILETAREKVAATLTPGDNHGQGDINMTKSQISTSMNAADLYIVSAGDVNVGKSAFSSGEDKNTGIMTVSGGSVNIYAGNDINVNESRVVAFGGGDIMSWADRGSINAGRGSRTAVNTTPPIVRRNVDSNGKLISVDVIFQPPSVGSGYRAMTFDPDGEEGPKTAPPIGDIYLFAPEGAIDAGEAGISGNNIFLAAREVLNVQNIEIAGTSVGVPDTAPATAGIGALSGAGGVSETAKMAEDSVLGASDQERFSKMVDDLAESLVPKWLAVEVIGFIDDDDEDEDNEAD